MKKLLALVMVLALSTIGLSAQLAPDYEKAFRKIQKSSVMIHFISTYEDKIKDPKTGEVKVVSHKHRYRGSGTIVGKESRKNRPHIYYVLTARHLLISHRDKLGNPIDDLKKAKSLQVVFARFTHEGTEEPSLHVGTGWWIVPVKDPKLDFAVLRFESAEDIPVAKIHPNLPRNLFGKTGLTVAAAAGLIPVPAVLYLGANKPANQAELYEFNYSGACRPGMSGAGIFVLHAGEWKLAGIIEAQYGGGGPLGFGIRIDVIQSTLKRAKHENWLKEK